MRKRIGNDEALLVLLCIFAPTIAMGAAGPNVTPLDCDNSRFLQAVNDFRKQPEQECAQNAPAKCDELPPAEAIQGRGRSVCKTIYIKISLAVDDYDQAVKRRCQESNTALQACLRKTPGSADQYECLKVHHEMVNRHESEVAELMMRTQDKLMQLEQRAAAARDRYREQKRLGERNNMQGPMPSGLTMGDASMDQRCLGAFRVNRRPGDVFSKSPDLPTSEGRIIDEQTNAIKISERFRRLAFSTADGHQKKAKEFQSRASQFRDLAQRMVTGASDSKKSDITGTDQKQGAPSAGGPAGGGGSQGGGPQGGSASSFDQGGGAAAGTPASANAGSAKSPASEASKLGKRLPEARSSAPSESPMTVGAGPKLNSGGAGGDGDYSGGSRGLASEGVSTPKSVMAKASAHGGGGAGVSSGGSAAFSEAGGKECQALGATSGQFASMGSLGGGAGGFGGDSAAASLDNIFKTDESASSGTQSAESLAGMKPEGGTELGALDEGEHAAASMGAEIGGVESGDLFLRVRSTHLRAQKKGFVAGITKKL